ncbi:choice-of-anchor J domain-containing protein [Kordia sp. YSTF-M3]|uniref:Choice-of-anchor J domain-containing protein n=1 Tax=Kordia aestuariivivens TaxID=2759037 RepID=A0ABR7Q9D6_9FLAO|nr:DUF5689 domain-containing protein [Kordia aestuariivivens]MBC8755171.1 choice-of-anchor J domain-containing protein [Kordia aestuariivivens]
MKANKIFSLIAVSAIMGLVITSCVQDDEFAIPTGTTVVDPGLTANATFSNMVARYQQAAASGDDIAVIELDEAEIIIEGYVISSDQAGNFFEELVIQNKTDGSDDAADPRLGFRVDINQAGLFSSYGFGRKVYIKMNGLAIGLENGVYAIGKPNGNDIDQIQPFELEDFVVRGTQVEDITPKVTTVAELTAADENTLIQLEDVQFRLNQLGLSYAGEASDSFDGFRNIEECVAGGSIVLQTSTFADFKSLTIDENKGTIQGIFTRDFGDDTNVLVINTLADINFTETTRCDPDILNCQGPTSTAVTVFEEDFESITNEAQLDALGWTNVNVSGGSERFEDGSFSGDRYMVISAFGTGEDPMEVWLVTPTINLDGTTEEELSFNVSANFETGTILEVYVSTDFTGDPTTAEWSLLDANIPVGGSGFGSFVPSDVNISCLDGDVHIGFKYLGAAGGAETRYHVDDVKVTGM